MKKQTTDWNQLAIDHEITYLKGDLATSSPESYTVEEMKAISDEMFSSTAEVEAALKADFALDAALCPRKDARPVEACGPEQLRVVAYPARRQHARRPRPNLNLRVSVFEAAQLLRIPNRLDPCMPKGGVF